MAQAGLYMFLGEFLKDMGDLDPELRESYDLEPIIFTFQPKDLSDILTKAAKAQTNWTPSPDDIAFIVSQAKVYGKKLQDIIVGLGGHPYGDDGMGCRLRFTVRTGIRALPGGGDWRKYGKDAIQNLPQSSFNKIKTSYRTTLQNYFKSLQDKFGEESTGNTKTGKKGKGGFRTKGGKRMGKGSIGSIIDLGHIDGVLETSIQRTLESTFKKNEQALQNLGVKDLDQLKRQMQRAGISLKVVRAKDGEGFETRLEFKGDNQSSGNKSKQKKATFLEACENTVNRLGSKLGEIEGSDSILQRNRKLIIKAMVKDFKTKGKVVRVKTENIKLNISKGGAATKSIGKANIKAGKVITAGAAARIVGKAGATKGRSSGRRKPAATKMPLHNILGILNSRLPQQVAENMGAPRLENQTGKFAGSVRAIDINETAKGFPSIGYTYEKQPYQVFESTSGSRFSDVHRDPRTLIETSIREIVAQFGLGRLYTRRL